MPDGERVTTGSEPRRFRLKRPTPANVPFVGDGVHVVAGKKATLKPGEEIEVQEVVESGHDEQTEARKNIERMRELTAEVARLNAQIHGAEHSETCKPYREALKDNAEFAMRVERLEAENEKLRAFFNAALPIVDEHVDWIEGRGPQFLSPHGKSSRDARMALDRARGVLQKDTGNTEHA